MNDPDALGQTVYGEVRASQGSQGSLGSHVLGDDYQAMRPNSSILDFSASTQEEEADERAEANDSHATTLNSGILDGLACTQDPFATGEPTASSPARVEDGADERTARGTELDDPEAAGESDVRHIAEQRHDEESGGSWWTRDGWGDASQTTNRIIAKKRTRVSRTSGWSKRAREAQFRQFDKRTREEESQRRTAEIRDYVESYMAGWEGWSPELTELSLACFNNKHHEVLTLGSFPHVKENYRFHAIFFEMLLEMFEMGLIKLEDDNTWKTGLPVGHAKDLDVENGIRWTGPMLGGRPYGAGTLTAADGAVIIGIEDGNTREKTCILSLYDPPIPDYRSIVVSISPK